MSATGVPTEKSADERKTLLEAAVAHEVKHGWRLESQEDFHAVLVRQRRSVYFLQVILTALMAPQAESIRGERREIITVDEYGETETLR